MANPRMVLAIVAAALLAGCAHQMVISPNTEGLTPEASRIPKNVGLYVPPADLSKEVTTAGGGGDKVSYRPYADMQTGVYKMLGDVFQSVTTVSSLNDAAAIEKHSLTYMVEPEITTVSSSSGVFTWMATDFTVNLTCKITDVSGQSVANVSVSGIGHADFSELKSNFSLAGERASQDALQKAQAALAQTAALRK